MDKIKESQRTNDGHSETTETINNHEIKIYRYCFSISNTLPPGVSIHEDVNRIFQMDTINPGSMTKKMLEQSAINTAISIVEKEILEILTREVEIKIGNKPSSKTLQTIELYTIICDAIEKINGNLNSSGIEVSYDISLKENLTIIINKYPGSQYLVISIIGEITDDKKVLIEKNHISDIYNWNHNKINNIKISELSFEQFFGILHLILQSMK